MTVDAEAAKAKRQEVYQSPEKRATRTKVTS